MHAALANGRVLLQQGQLITFRNNLNKLMATPYASRDDWEMGVQVLGQIGREVCVETGAERDNGELP